MSQRIAIFSDIHANTAAFNHCVKDAKKKSVDEFHCLGDLCGYGYDPKGTVKLAKNIFKDRVIPGNHDLGITSLQKGSDEILVPFFDPKLPARLPALMTWHLHRLALQDEPSLWKWYAKMFTMEKHAKSKMVNKNACQILLSHSGYIDFTKYHLPNRHDLHRELVNHIISGDLKSEIQFAGPPKPGSVTLAFSGHTHVPMIFKSGEDYLQIQPLSFEYEKWMDLDPGVYLINPGSVGQPRDDDDRPSYVVIECLKNKTRIMFRRPSSVYHVALNGYKELNESYLGWKPNEKEKNNLKQVAVSILLHQAQKDIAKFNWLYNELIKLSDIQEEKNQLVQFAVEEMEEQLELSMNDNTHHWTNEFNDVCYQNLVIPWDNIIEDTYRSIIEILSGARGDYNKFLNQVYKPDRTRGYFIK